MPTMDDSGRVTIPVDIRERLDISPGTEVDIHVDDDGRIIVECIDHVPSPNEMRGYTSRRESTTDNPATEALRNERSKDRDERDEQFTDDS